MNDFRCVRALCRLASVAIAAAVLAGCRTLPTCEELRDLPLFASDGVRLGEKTERVWSTQQGVSVDPASGRVWRISHQWDGLSEERAFELFDELVDIVDGIGGGTWDEDSDTQVRYVVRKDGGDEQTYMISVFPSGDGRMCRVRFVCFDKDIMFAVRQDMRGRGGYHEDRTSEQKTKTVKYVVEEGEDVISVAIQFSVKPADIRAWNGIPDDGCLEPGQEIVLKIPMR